MTLADKDINIGFVATILGDKPRKQKYHQPQQPTYYQQAPNQAPPAPGVPPAPQMQQAVQEQAATQAPGASDNKGKFCPNCGKENISGAVFCAGCGTKI